MAATRARVGLQLIKSTTPRSLVYTNLSNEQTYFSPPSGGDYILKWDDAATDLTWLSTSSLINIYNNDGALSSSRTLTGGANTLNFNFNDGVSYNSDYVANSVLQYLTVIDTALDTSASVEVSPYSVILSAIDNLSSRQAQLSLGVDITLYRSGAVGANSITFSDTGMLVTDSNTSQGLKYAADYAAYFATNPRSIPDVGYVNSLLSTHPTGSGVANRFTLWSGASTQTSSAAFTFSGNHMTVGDTTNHSRLRVNNVSATTSFASAGTEDNLWLQNTNATNNNWSGVSSYSSGSAIDAGIGFQHINHASNYADIVFYNRGTSGFNANLRIGSDRSITFPNLSGTGTRLATITSTGILGSFTGVNTRLLYTGASGVTDNGNLFFNGTTNLLNVGDYTLASGLNVRGGATVSPGGFTPTAGGNYILTVSASPTTTVNNANVEGINTNITANNDGTRTGASLYGVRSAISATDPTKLDIMSALIVGGTNTSPNVAQFYGLYGRIDENSSSGNLSNRSALRFDLNKNDSASVLSHSGIALSVNIADITASGRWLTASGIQLNVTNAKTAYGGQIGTSNTKGTGNLIFGATIGSNVSGAGVTATEVYGVDISLGVSGGAVVTDYYGFSNRSSPAAANNYFLYANNAGWRNYLNGNLSLGPTNNNTARLYLSAGTTASGTAPLKFGSGTNLSAPEAGAMEWDGTRGYLTQTSGPTRQTLAYLSDLTTAGIGSGVANQWAYWSSAGTLTTSNILKNNTSYVDMTSANGLILPSRTTFVNQPGGLYAVTGGGYGSNQHLYYLPRTGSYGPVLLGGEFQSGVYGNWTNSIPMNPDLYSIMYATNGTRWTILNTGSNLAGGTYVRTYTLNTLALTSPANGGLTYPAGKLLFGFWYTRTPAAISVRFRNSSGTFFGPYTVDLTKNLNNGDTNFGVYGLDIGANFNYLNQIEITITVQAGSNLDWSWFDYVQRDSGDLISPYKYLNLSGTKARIPMPFEWHTGSAVGTNINAGGSYFNVGGGNNDYLGVGTATLMSNTALTVVNPVADNGSYYSIRARTIGGTELFSTRGDGTIGMGAVGTTNKRLRIVGIGSTSSTATISVENSSNVNPYFHLYDDASIYLGRLIAGGSTQAVYIGHNGTTGSSNDGTATLKFYSQYGNTPFTMGAEGNGYNFWIRQTNGGQGLLGFDFGTITSTLYQKTYTYVTDHYEDIYTGKWLLRFSGAGNGGNYFGVYNAITSNGIGTIYDTYRISKNTTGNWPVSAEPLISFFNGDSAGTVTAISRYVSRINRLGFLGIGTDITLGTSTRGHQAGITVDIPSRAGVLTGDGVTAIHVRTTGSSTTAFFSDNSNGATPIGIQVGSRITANGVTRTVVNLVDHANVTLDSAVNWDNGGVGYTFTYTNAFISLQDGSNKYLVVDGLGNTGLNTGTPTQRLDVNGGMRLRGPLYDYTNSPGTVDMIMVSLNTTGAQWQSLATLNVPTGSGADTQIAYYVGGHSITSENGTGLDSFTWDYNNNRLGVRVASPLSTLHLNNGIDTSAYAIFTGSLTGSTNVTSLALNRTAGSGSLDLIQTHSGTGNNCLLFNGNSTGDSFVGYNISGPAVGYTHGVDSSDGYIWKFGGGGYNVNPSTTTQTYLSASSSSGKIGLRTNPHGTQDIYMLGTLRLDLGSDAAGDTYYRDATGAFTKLPIGSPGDVLTVSSGIPAWTAPSGGSGTVTGTGSAGQVSYWSTTTAQAGTNDLFWNTSTNRLGIGGTVTPVARLHIKTDGLGTTQTVNSGIYISNGTAAAAGAQQISPSLILVGSGWKTASTAASQSMAFRMFVTPIQGISAPTSFLGIGSSVNGFYTDNQFVFTNEGKFAIGTTTPDATSILDLTSTTLGVLLPRMTTTQKNAIISPANGLLLYDSTLNKLNVYESSAWKNLGDGIYNGSGSLSSSTTVSQGNYYLGFAGTSGAGHATTMSITPASGQFYVSAADTSGSGPILGELIVGEGFASMSVGDDLIPTTTLTGISFANTGSNWNWGPLSITIDGSGIHVDTAGFDGFIYVADYSASILANNRSIPDIFTVRENAIENYNTITSTSSPLNLNGLAPDYLIAQGGTQATFTFSLPATPDDGEICKLTFSTAVTTLTITAQGGITILGTAATTAAIGTQLEYKFYSTISAWIRTK